MSSNTYNRWRLSSKMRKKFINEKEKYIFIKLQTPAVLLDGNAADFDHGTYWPIGEDPERD